MRDDVGERAAVVVLIILINSRQAVQTVFLLATTAMDNLKVHDSQLDHLDHLTPLQFLALQPPARPLHKTSLKSQDTDICEAPAARLLPTYSFSMGSYSIGQHVQYCVVLREEFKILGRTVRREYEFSTRYSMLEALDRRMGGKGLPGKKIFGNKSPQFVEKRKAELERYLNRVARGREPEFYRFVKQIKDCSFNASLKEKFSLE